MEPSAVVPEPTPANVPGSQGQPLPPVPAPPAAPPEPAAPEFTMPAVPAPVAPTPLPAQPASPAPTSELFAPDAPRGPAAAMNPDAGMPGYMPPTAAVQSMSFNSQKKKRPPLVPILGGGVLLALIVAGTVFGYVLPNRPENVWSTGLNRSGKAIGKLVDTASEKKTLDNFKKSEISATLSATFEGQSYSGTLATKYDDTGSNGSLVIDAKQTGQPDQTYSLNFIGQLIKDHAYPTTYLQLSGFKTLGLDFLLPGVSEFDGKWISVDESYYKSLGLDSLTTQKSELTATDFAELAHAATTVTTKHVFTADPKFAVFERRSIVGKEKVDGITAFHYVVGINKDRVVDYCNDMIDTVTAAAAYKKLPTYKAETIDDDKKSAKKDCADSSKNIKDTDTFDMWIDAKYKLVYKLRFTDDKNKDNYIDVGQKYNGGDDINFFVHGVEADSKIDGVFNFKTNIKTYLTSADLTVSGKGESPFDVKVALAAKPFTGTVDTKTPAGAIKLEDVMKQLGIDPNEFLGSSASEDSFTTTSSSKDVKTKTDVNNLYAHLEEYWAGHTGSYPTLANFSSAAWRKTNMPGLDSDTDFTIGASATATQFGYVSTGCKGNDCTNFTLSAKLSDGTDYTKNSLN